MPLELTCRILGIKCWVRNATLSTFWLFCHEIQAQLQLWHVYTTGVDFSLPVVWVADILGVILGLQDQWKSHITYYSPSLKRVIREDITSFKDWCVYSFFKCYFYRKKITKISKYFMLLFVCVLFVEQHSHQVLGWSWTTVHKDVRFADTIEIQVARQHRKVCVDSFFFLTLHLDIVLNRQVFSNHVRLKQNKINGWISNQRFPEKVNIKYKLATKNNFMDISKYGANYHEDFVFFSWKGQTTLRTTVLPPTSGQRWQRWHQRCQIYVRLLEDFLLKFDQVFVQWEKFKSSSNRCQRVSAS